MSIRGDLALMGEILVLCPLMNKSTLAYSTLYSGNTKGNWEKEKSARSELTARFALVELRGLDLLCGRGRGAALAAHRAAIHSRARSSPRWPRQKKKSARFKHTARFALVELRGLEPLTSTLPVLRTSQLYYSPKARLSLAYLSAPVKSREGGGP